MTHEEAVKFLNEAFKKIENDCPDKRAVFVLVMNVPVDDNPKILNNCASNAIPADTAELLRDMSRHVRMMQYNN